MQKAGGIRYDRPIRQRDETGSRRTVIDPSREIDGVLDVLIRDGRIAEIAPRSTCRRRKCWKPAGWSARRGWWICTFTSATRGRHIKKIYTPVVPLRRQAALLSLACMPNTTPVCDNPAVIGDIVERAASAPARVYPVAAVTASLGGERLTDFAALKAAGAVAVSDDGRPVPTAGRMLEAMEKAAALSLPVLSHCEDLSLTRGGIMNEGTVSAALGVPGIHRAAEDTATRGKSRWRPPPVCRCISATSAHGGSVALLRDARRRGVPVTGETAPHYFLLTDELLRGRDADYRMNPPLRTEDDRRAVIEGLKDGTLTAIATDHAPHSPEDKADFLHAPNGSIGMETSLAAGITALVVPGCLSLSRLIWLMSTEPARLLGIPGGTLCPGAPADIVLFDPDAEWTVDPGRCTGNPATRPFKGMKLRGRVRHTLLGGKTVYTAE